MTVDASALFARTLEGMMREMGFMERFSHEECRETVRVCVEACFREAWDEFCAWVAVGDDMRARTRLLVGGLAMGGAMFREPGRVVRRAW